MNITLIRLINYKGNILELGRSCVAKDYRTGSTMQLLWSFISQYVFKYDIDDYVWMCFFSWNTTTVSQKKHLIIYIETILLQKILDQKL